MFHRLNFVIQGINFLRQPIVQVGVFFRQAVVFLRQTIVEGGVLLPHDDILVFDVVEPIENRLDCVVRVGDDVSLKLHTVKPTGARWEVYCTSRALSCATCINS